MSAFIIGLVEVIVSWLPDGVKSGLGWWKKPKPVISFEYLLSETEENNYCHCRRNSDFGLDWGWFFRIGINNLGKEMIQSADVRVEKIEEVTSGKIITTSPFFLHWANEATDNSRNIHYDTLVFLDVVFTMEGKNVFGVFHKMKHSGSGVLSHLPAGEYKFLIKLLGENIDPVQKEIYVEFDGNWENLKMKIED